VVDHLEDGCVAESNVLLLEWHHRIVADGVQDEFLACLFDAQVVPVALLFDLVLHHKLLARRGCIACCEGIGRVCAWIDQYRVVPGGVANNEPVLPLGDRTRQMAVILSLIVVMGLRHSEYSAELVFELVNGLWRDDTIEACQLVAEGDECIVRVVRLLMMMRI
jgi:hypothetical protein